jgi:(2R)-3-sulfolactate dehydrogenase (NADP+)
MKYRTARRFVADLLAATGMPVAAADETAQAIVVAQAWRVFSHGLMRLPYYLTRLRAGGYRPDATLKSTSDTGPVVAMDGCGGLGHWQAWRAAETAAERARRYGIAAVSVADSGHCGSLGVYLFPLLRRGMAGLVLSNGPAVMPPWGGSAPVLSTSPLAFGAPLPDGPAIVDLATSAGSRGAIANHARAGTPLPAGWALDADGDPTVDPAAAMLGMLAPMGGAKGFALAFAIEALTGGLVGPALSTDVADPFSAELAATPQRIAHLVIGLSPAAFAPDGSALTRWQALADAVSSAGGRVPGARRTDPADIPDDTPVEVDDELAATLSRWADDLGVSSIVD